MPGSELVVLFGDELEEVQPAKVGTKVANGARVSLRDLAIMIVAVGVADLVQRGAATLGHQQTTKFFRSKRSMTLAVEQDAGDGFTELVARSAHPQIQVDQVLLAILGRKVLGPERALLLVAHGFLEPTGAVLNDGGLLRRAGTALGVSADVIQPARAATLRPDWEPLRDAWMAWKAADADLAAELVEQLRKGIAVAKDYSE
ncbi:MAG: hypothetical protein ACRDVW_01230 [Acidimicrobiales bacterium]